MARGSVGASETDGVAAHIGVVGARQAHSAPVEQRQHGVVVVGHQANGSGDVRLADRALLGFAQPGGGVLAARGVRIAVPVVMGGCHRAAGGPLGVEVVVVGSHHEQRAVQGGVVGLLAPRDIGVRLALQVAHVAVAVRQQRDRRGVRRGLPAEVGGADEDLPGDPVGRRQPGHGARSGGSLTATAVADQDDVSEIGGDRGPDRARVGRVCPRREVAPHQAGPGGRASVEETPVLCVDAVRRDRHSHITLAGEELLDVVITEIAGHRARVRGTRPFGVAVTDGVRVAVARVVPAVQEEDDRGVLSGIRGAHDVTEHLDLGRHAGQLDSGQPVRAGRHRMRARSPGIGGQARRAGQGRDHLLRSRRGGRRFIENPVGQDHIEGAGGRPGGLGERDLHATTARHDGRHRERLAAALDERAGVGDRQRLRRCPRHPVSVLRDPANRPSSDARAVRLCGGRSSGRCDMSLRRRWTGRGIGLRLCGCGGRRQSGWQRKAEREGTKADAVLGQGHVGVSGVVVTAPTPGRFGVRTIVVHARSSGRQSANPRVGGMAWGRSAGTRESSCCQSRTGWRGSA